MNIMKKIIMLGICVTSLILLLAPTIPAQQYKEVEESIQINMQEQFDLITNILQNINSGKDNIKYYENSINNALNSIKEKLASFDYYTLSFGGFIINTLISLLFAFIGTIFGILFGPILSALVKFLTAPAILLAKLISILIGENALTAI